MSIVIRVISNAGRSRIEMDPSQTIAVLKAELAKRLGVSAATIKMFSDQALKKAVSGRDSDSLTKAGLKNGDIIHVNNEAASI